jgi:hypothetical protein
MAIADEKTLPMTLDKQSNLQNASFVDGNGICTV